MQTIYPYAILKNDVEDIIFGGKLMLNGKTILITGGTGSFGKCFTKYVLIVITKRGGTICYLLLLLK